jgi:hypothetical protein
MKTRTIVLVLLALLVIGGCSPKEADMPAVGDLFAKMGRGETLAPGEIETLRLEMNRMQSVASKASDVLNMAGAGLDPNVFQNSGMFSLLPHEVGGLYQLQATAQVIPNDTWTTMLPDTAATTDATRSKGLRIDVTNGRIYVEGIPRETEVQIVAWAAFATNTTGLRGVKWVSDDGSQLISVQSASEVSGAAGAAMVQLSHLRKVNSAHSYYYMQVYQNSGGNLALDSAYFAMARVR